MFPLPVLSLTGGLAVLWSVPQVANGGQSENKMRNLPVPVFLRPLDEKNTSMKVRLGEEERRSGGGEEERRRGGEEEERRS